MNVPVDIRNVIIETERLILRPWKSDDLNDFYSYASVNGVGQLAGWNPHKSKEESQNILNMFMADKKTFALELKRNKKVIGSIGLEEIAIDIGEPYTSLGGREIGYVLSKEYWGQGLMPEAVTSVINHCFKELHYDFLQCSHSFENEQSKRVIEKVGFLYIQDCERTGLNGITHKSKIYISQNPYSTTLFA